MKAATSTIVKENSQEEICIYCVAKLRSNWKHIIMDGLEYKVTECENGHKARIKVEKDLSLEQFVSILNVGWSRA